MLYIETTDDRPWWYGVLCRLPKRHSRSMRWDGREWIEFHSFAEEPDERAFRLLHSQDDLVRLIVLDLEWMSDTDRTYWLSTI